MAVRLKAPISVTPGAIDTPYTLHAKNQMEGKPTRVPPVYAPEVVAKTILECAEHPVRELMWGSRARLFPLLDRLSPRIQDFLMYRFYMENKQSKDKRAARTEEALEHPPAHEAEERGNYEGHVFESSLYIRAALTGARSRKLLCAGALAAAMAGVAGYVLRRGGGRRMWPRMGASRMISRTYLKMAALADTSLKMFSKCSFTSV